MHEDKTIVAVDIQELPCTAMLTIELQGLLSKHICPKCDIEALNGCTSKTNKCFIHAWPNYIKACEKLAISIRFQRL